MIMFNSWRKGVKGSKYNMRQMTLSRVTKCNG